MKLIVKDNIGELINIDEELSDNNINCIQHQPSEGSYNFYIFTCDFNSEVELVNKYKIINEVIAFDFQRTLIRDIEKWNLYVFYFVNEKLSEDAKFLVEQNKYATRKLVFDDLGSFLDLEEKKAIIQNKLFNLELVDKRKEKDKDMERVSTLIKKTDPKLFNLIETTKEIKGKTLKQREKKTMLIKSYLEGEVE